ncbi:MAG: tetratricopeptide repeat protein [Actinobacteria bacterium]|nr:tetratricopeptide repeat protein [Actinomycetota bacterium]
MTQSRDFSLYGAVDLGARRAAAQRSQQAASGGGPGGGSQDGHVIDVTDATFEAEVIQRSASVPVIIDLWAEWCGPCKQLSPILEKLAGEANGAWVLAKVDVDANPQLSAALQVQSIPMVLVAIGGQLAPGFMGALPEPQVRQFIGQVQQAAERLGLSPGGGPPGAETGQDATADEPGGPADPAFADAQRAMESGDLDGAAAAFRRVLADTPDHPAAKLGLAQVELISRVNGYDHAQARRAAAESPGDIDAQSRVADIDLAEGKAEDAFDRMLGVIRRTSGDDRDRARVHLISLFDVLPPRDPRVSKARATLSSLLF